MISAGIKQVKNHLSRLLLEVKAGRVVVITDRGRPVARIVSTEDQAESIRASLEPLIRSGTVSMPTRPIEKKNLTPVVAPGKPASQIVQEDRR